MTTPPRGSHIPVMLDEVLGALLGTPTDRRLSGPTCLDCTAGLGGHAAAIAEGMAGGGKAAASGKSGGAPGTVVLVDLDAANLESAATRLKAIKDGPRVHTFHGSFAAAPRKLERLGLTADMVLADLGFASIHVDDPDRGFSFSRDGPLDMRLNPHAGATAADLVNSLPESELARIIREFGEERHAGLVARRITESRRAARIERTAQLADLVRSVVKRTPGGIDPATRTFQALRMAVNDELGNLEAFLSAIERSAAGHTPIWLAPTARLAIITFHSLEDRPVKQAFARLTTSGRARDLLGGGGGSGGRGHAAPSDAEIRTNPRSASAKLRAVELVPGKPTAPPEPRA